MSVLVDPTGNALNINPKKICSIGSSLRLCSMRIYFLEPIRQMVIEKEVTAFAHFGHFGHF